MSVPCFMGCISFVVILVGNSNQHSIIRGIAPQLVRLSARLKNIPRKETSSLGLSRHSFQRQRLPNENQPAPSQPIKTNINLHSKSNRKLKDIVVKRARIRVELKRSIFFAMVLFTNEALFRQFPLAATSQCPPSHPASGSLYWANRELAPQVGAPHRAQKNPRLERRLGLFRKSERAGS